MTMSKVLLLCQIVGYLIGLTFSLFIIAPMSINLYKFEYNCLLFAHVQWNGCRIQWGSSAYCGYVMFIGVLIFIVCIVQIYRCLKLFYNEGERSFLLTFLEAVGCILLSALSMYAACIVTLGFMTWCNDILKRYPTCQDAGGEVMPNNTDIDTLDFYSDINTVQISTWAVFTTCVGLAVCLMVKVCYLHRMANIPIAMRGERQPLLNESGSSTPTRPAER